MPLKNCTLCRTENSPPKPITRVLDSALSKDSGASPPTHWPIPTSLHIKQLVLEELRIIAGTISSHLDWPEPLLELHLAHTSDGRTSTPTWLAPECGCLSFVLPRHSHSIRYLQLGVPSLRTRCTDSQTWHVQKKNTVEQWLWCRTQRDLLFLTSTYQSR